MPNFAISAAGRRAVVAIDGPVASGKSSVGQAAAAELGLRFLDTGVMYRAVTWLALHRDIPVSDANAVGILARDCRMALPHDAASSAITIDGHTPGPELWDAAVVRSVSAVSAVPAVRRALVQQQRAISKDGGIVMAGRDIGSIVLPNADVKLYIDASAEARAQRRLIQQQESNPAPASDPATEYARVLADVIRRDTLDSQRADSPLAVADGAIVIATDGISLAQTVAAVVDAVRSALDGAAAAE